VLGATTQVVEPQTVDIVWSTNIPATSQVVYGLTIGGPYTLAPNSTNFGYPFATGKDNAKVLSHSVSIPNILVGQSYSLRVVSGVSTPTFGREYRFTLNADGSVKFEGIFGGELMAVLGPLVFGVAAQAGGVRRGVLSLLVFFILGGTVLVFVKEPGTPPPAP
jgi:hypothetical protein